MRKNAVHASRSEVGDLLAGSLPAEERRRIVQHLLAGCETCAQLVRGAIFSEHPEYDGVVRRLGLSMVLAENDVAVERMQALEAWAVLKALSPEGRLLQVKHQPELQTWGMYEKLLDEAKESARNAPLQAVDLAHLALAVTERLSTEAYGEEKINDYQAAALIRLANAKRLGSDLRGAESALRRAEKLLDEGTGDPYERAHLLSIDASLKTDLGYFEEAEKILIRAAKLARRVKDRHLEGRIVIKLSGFLGFLDPAQGLELVEKGLAMISKDREPALELTGRYLVAFWTNELGEPQEAEAILFTYAYLYKKLDGVFWQGRLLHLRANIARQENDLQRAELCFRDLVQLYQEHSFEFDLALAALDLAEVLTARGSFQESEEILAAVYPILQTWNIHVDILRAWLLLRENVQSQQVAREAFRELAMTLRRKWYRKEEGK
jgi:tetratricopeptide (TPR) repeat protein